MDVRNSSCRIRSLESIAMHIKVPFSNAILDILELLLKSPFLKIRYAHDETQINADGGELTLELWIENDSKVFRIHGRACFAIKRHDLPQIIAEDVTLEKSHPSLPLSRTIAIESYVDSAFLLWQKEPYAGTCEIFKGVEYIIYSNGIIFNFRDRDPILLAASMSEPDILVLSKKEEIGKYIQSTYEVELFFQRQK